MWLNGEHLKERVTRPACFSHLPRFNHRWFNLCQGESVFGHAAVGRLPGDAASLHTEILTRFRPSLARATVFAYRHELVPQLKWLGVKRVVASKPFKGEKDADKWVKFIRMIGFEDEPKVVLVAEQRI
jgi:hypothetical protein